ncbi:MYND finger [Trichuris suis]|nr:MYND finger [Trichuris suis]
MMPSVLEEWPWAYVLLDSETMQYCHYCFRRCDDLLECSVCEFAVYCNTKCQKNAWPDHSGECFLIARTPYDLPTTIVRLISRVLIKINMQGLKSDILMTTTLTDYKKPNFEELDSHYKEINEDASKATNFTQCMHQLHMFMDAERLPAAARLVDIYGKIAFNSLLILNNDLNPIGLGIYLTFSQFQHSCLPNSAVVFNGPTAILNYLGSTPPEKKDAAASYTISYGPIIEETEMRRRYLYNNYYFVCQCPRCSDENFDLIASSLSCKTENCPGHVAFRQSNEMPVASATSSSDSTEFHAAVGTCDVCGKSVENLWESKILMITSNQENDTFVDEDSRMPNILSRHCSILLTFKTE